MSKMKKNIKKIKFINMIIILLFFNQLILTK